MKSIFLSVVIICALAIAGIGGTFANMSDTEMVKDNAFSTGYIDLLVEDDSGAFVNDDPWGIGADSTFNVEWAEPGKIHTDSVKVQNCGTIDTTLYIHFKNFRCSNVDPIHACAGICFDEGAKPEPEAVEEYGGYLDQIEILPGGIKGDDCTMDELLKVRVYYRGVLVLLRGNEWNRLSKLECNWYELGLLEECGVTRTVRIDVMYDNIKDPAWAGNKLFKYHPTNAYMADKILFDINFGVITEDP